MQHSYTLDDIQMTPLGLVSDENSAPYSTVALQEFLEIDRGREGKYDIFVSVEGRKDREVGLDLTAEAVASRVRSHLNSGNRVSFFVAEHREERRAA